MRHSGARERGATLLIVMIMLIMLTLFAIVWGVITLIARTTLDRVQLAPWWGGMAAIVILIIAFARGARRAPARAKLAAWRRP